MHACMRFRMRSGAQFSSSGMGTWARGVPQGAHGPGCHLRRSESGSHRCDDFHVPRSNSSPGFDLVSSSSSKALRLRTCNSRRRLLIKPRCFLMLMLRCWISTWSRVPWLSRSCSSRKRPRIFRAMCWRRGEVTPSDSISRKRFWRASRVTCSFSIASPCCKRESSLWFRLVQRAARCSCAIFSLARWSLSMSRGVSRAGVGALKVTALARVGLPRPSGAAPATGDVRTDSEVAALNVPRDMWGRSPRCGPDCESPEGEEARGRGCEPPSGVESRA
mmetsp:Transcript_41392/g.128979  ORF Transcript_41392/g.128979 Transcript_41392/m.128979 type:complete len:276 (+) Transcript_41392:178-1005(+)